MGQSYGAGNGPVQQSHVPVLLAEVLAALQPLEGAHVVDGTFGAGGYSRALLEGGAHVTGIDRDPNVAPFASDLRKAVSHRFTFVTGEFSELDTLVDRATDGVVLDIGVSSMQLDAAERGFSFMREGPLDMRMSGEGPSAADLVNGLAEVDLANLLFAFGEERKARRVAAAICKARDAAPIRTTTVLAEIIEAAIGRRAGDIHPATRSFQALRIAVNAEFDQLVGGLFAAERLLTAGGRLAVVTFHSLEDRIVKRFLAQDKTGPARSRHLPQQAVDDARWDHVARAVRPSPAERQRNPRARSATLRSACRTAAPARPVSQEGLGVPGSRMRGRA